ncbi:MAG: PH domain-containing protein [Acidobacteria bacterium]|nr:PH domain-containing protein [Acidobacteriota bacterium]
MSFPRRLLTEDEEVILDLRPHWIALARPAFWTAVLGAGAGLAVAYAPAGSARGPLRIAAAAAALVAWIPLAGVPALRWRFTMFVVTSERLVSRGGVLAKHGKEVPLETINDVTFHQSVFERIIGAGDLVIESAGESGQERFTDIRRPEGVQLRIYRAAEARKGIARGGAPVANELEKLAGLRDRGVLNAEEFEARKRRLLEG